MSVSSSLTRRVPNSARPVSPHLKGPHMTLVQESTQLAKVVQENGLVPETAETLITTFSPFFDEVNASLMEASRIVVNDATEVSAMKAARAARLKLRDVRIRVEAARKSLKEDSLRKGKAIDGIANVLKFMIEPEENRLEEAEKFAERAEASRRATLRQSRATLIAPFGMDTSAMMLEDMTEEAFQNLLGSARIAHEKRIADEKAAAEARAEAERKRAEEEARVRAENERLRLEAEASRKAAEEELAKAEAERRAAEAKAAAELKAERDRVAALEAQAAREKAAAEAKAAAEEQARRDAAAAPDRAKLAAFAVAIRAVEMPECVTASGQKTAADIAAKREAFAVWIESQIKAMK